MSIIPYVIYLYLLGFHVTIFSDVSSIFGVTIDLAGLMVCLVAIYKKEMTALWFALAAAIVVGATRLDLMPWEMLFLGILAIGVKQLSIRVNLESVASRLVLLAVGILFHRLAMSLAISTADFFMMLYRYLLPGVVYTWVLGWIYFLYRDGHLTWARFRALF